MIRIMLPVTIHYEVAQTKKKENMILEKCMF